MRPRTVVNVSAALLIVAIGILPVILLARTGRRSRD